MADIFSKEKRSQVMAQIKGKDTVIEKRVFRGLWREKMHFQKHYRKVRGCPDVAIPSLKKAVFIDGDFWHGWRFSRTKDKLPEFWRNKIETNMKRDRKNRSALKRKGWSVLRVWEHDMKKDEDNTIRKIVLFLRGR